MIYNMTGTLYIHRWWELLRTSGQIDKL